jgi:hypothetical protein
MRLVEDTRHHNFPMQLMMKTQAVATMNCERLNDTWKQKANDSGDKSWHVCSIAHQVGR